MPGPAGTGTHVASPHRWIPTILTPPRPQNPMQQLQQHLIAQQQQPNLPGPSAAARSTPDPLRFELEKTQRELDKTQRELNETKQNMQADLILQTKRADRESSSRDLLEDQLHRLQDQLEKTEDDNMRLAEDNTRLTAQLKKKEEEKTQSELDLNTHFQQLIVEKDRQRQQAQGQLRKVLDDAHKVMSRLEGKEEDLQALKKLEVQLKAEVMQERNKRQEQEREFSELMNRTDQQRNASHSQELEDKKQELELFKQMPMALQLDLLFMQRELDKTKQKLEEAQALTEEQRKLDELLSLTAEEAKKTEQKLGTDLKEAHRQIRKKEEELIGKENELQEMKQREVDWKAERNEREEQERKFFELTASRLSQRDIVMEETVARLWSILKCTAQEPYLSNGSGDGAAKPLPSSPPSPPPEGTQKGSGQASSAGEEDKVRSPSKRRRAKVKPRNSDSGGDRKRQKMGATRQSPTSPDSQVEVVCPDKATKELTSFFNQKDNFPHLLVKSRLVSCDKQHFFMSLRGGDCHLIAAARLHVTRQNTSSRGLRRGSNYLEVILMAVHTDKRQKGYGRMLANEIKKFAAKEGYSVYLRAQSTAKAFWVKMGYELLNGGDQRPNLFCFGSEGDTHPMSLPLDETPHPNPHQEQR